MNKKCVWLLVAAATIASAFSVYYYFEKAFPFVHVSITMNAKQAEQSAITVAQEQDWNLQDYDCAVMFEDNGLLQAFVELEGGGKEAFVEMLDKQYYQPYLWRVRFFKEKEIFETVIKFTPDGKKWAFKQYLPEDQPGNNISELHAKKIAESAAAQWGHDLTPYELVEHSEKIEVSKRLDHTFVYERTDVSLGKGLYRLTIIVAGDQAVAMMPEIKIPDEFNRRYAEMSSTNHLIAGTAFSVVQLLYGFIFGLFGLFFLYRKRYLLIRQNLKILLLAAILGFMSWINWFPLVWNSYITTTSKAVFLLQTFGMMVLSVIFVAVLISVIFCMAESFDRYIFGRHIQFFKLWSPGVGGSYSVAQQTVLGYCLAVMGLGYVVGFYMLATSWGWWFPLQTMFDPNVLSMHVPSLTPCLRALSAGFWEELAFRVIPIAGILLLTRNSKHQRVWLIGMLIVQAILFGAAHASYPQQPAYFRIVEMFVEFFGYGCCYYVFGLLPCIIGHAVYDAVLMSVPIFTSTMLLQKILTVMLIGIPLWIVFFRWVQQKCNWSQIPADAYNDAWKPTSAEIIEQEPTRELGRSIPATAKKYAYAFGVVGLLLLACSKEFQFNTPPISVSQDCVKNNAKAAIKDRFGDIGDDWEVLASFMNSVQDNGNNFIWQEYGNKLYQELQGSYVVCPHYVVRFAKFVGPVEQRAEEYRVLVSPAGEVFSIHHTLPEAQPGADISEHHAKNMAYAFVHENYDLAHDDVELVLCSSIKHESRRDWVVVLRDIKNYVQDRGQAHIRIAICGDEVAGNERFIKAPEEWVRCEQERVTKKGLMTQGSFVGYFLLFFLFLLIVSSRVGLHLFLLRIGAMIAVALTIVKTVSMINGYENMRFYLNSAQPVSHQMQRWIMMHVTSLAGQALVVSMLLVFVLWSTRKGLVTELRLLIAPACALACGVIGIFSVVTILEPTMHASTPLYHFVNDKSSFVSMLLYMIGDILWEFLFVAAAWVIASRYTYVALQLLIFVMAGICIWGISGGWEAIWACLVLGAAWGVVWYALCKYFYAANIELLLITVTAMQCLWIIPSVWYQTYPMILVNFGLCVAVLGVAVVWGCKKLQAN